MKSLDPLLNSVPSFTENKSCCDSHSQKNYLVELARSRNSLFTNGEFFI